MNGSTEMSLPRTGVGEWVVSVDGKDLETVDDRDRTLTWLLGMELKHWMHEPSSWSGLYIIVPKMKKKRSGGIWGSCRQSDVDESGALGEMGWGWSVEPLEASVVGVFLLWPWETIMRLGYNENRIMAGGAGSSREKNLEQERCREMTVGRRPACWVWKWRWGGGGRGRGLFLLTPIPTRKKAPWGKADLRVSWMSGWMSKWWVQQSGSRRKGVKKKKSQPASRLRALDLAVEL